MRSNHNCYPSKGEPKRADATDPRRQSAVRKKKMTNSMLGMGAEFLVAGGLILIGFLISLLSGW